MIDFGLSSSGDLEVCRTKLEALRAESSTEAWRNFGRCVDAAETAADMRPCGELLVRPTAVGGVPIKQAARREWRACEHMAEIEIQERREMEPGTPEHRLRVAELANGCAEMLFRAERPARSPASFDALLACIESGTNSTEINRCF